MTIQVTPIPKLIEFATPAITIGATAAPGDALTAIRSNSTIAGVALITSVNDTIARYDGTGGQLQGYTSNAPTMSDAGVFTIASGQITFPATVNASSNANTLDDYEKGTWTPTLLDTNLNPSEGQSYDSKTKGVYTKIGDICHVQGTLWMSSLGSLTTSAGVHIGGLPFPTKNVANTESTFVFGYMAQLNLGTAMESPAVYAPPNVSYLRVELFDATTGVNSMTIAEWSADGFGMFSGLYKVEQ